MLAKLYKNRKILYEAMDKNAAYPGKGTRAEELERMKTIIKENPAVLGAFSGDKSTLSPLAEAVMLNDLDAAQIIIDALKNREYKNNILIRIATEGNGKQDYPYKDPLYMRQYQDPTLVSMVNSPHEHLPHQNIRTPEMLELFHKNEYDLNIINPDCLESDFFESVIQSFSPNGHYESYGIKSAEQAEPLLRKAVALGMDIRRKNYSFSYHNVGEYANIGLAEYLYRNLCRDILTYCEMKVDTNLVDFEKHEKCIAYTHSLQDYLKLFAKLGVDCRDILSQDFHMDPNIVIKAENRDSYLRMFDKLREHLTKYVTTAANDYESKITEQDRQDCALAACAGGTFPVLLDQCMRRDHKNANHAEVKELLGYIGEYWKHEYKNVIETTYSRLKPALPEIRNSRLATYLSGGTPENSGRA